MKPALATIVLVLGLTAPATIRAAALRETATGLELVSKGVPIITGMTVMVDGKPVGDGVTIRAVSTGNDAVIRLVVSGPSGKPLNARVRVDGGLVWGRRPIPARLREADATPGVVQSALGPYENTRLATVYDPDSDRAIEAKGQGVGFGFDPKAGGYRIHAESGGDSQVPLELRITEDLYKRERGVRYFSPIDKGRFPLPPSGWCSWYYYYQNLGEGDIRANAEWMAANLKPYGAEYVQVDDAWQGKGTGVGDNRDWTVIAPRFPSGMKSLADHIHSLGMKAGLWLAPHGQSSEAVANRNRDAFLWRRDGTSVGRVGNEDNWEGRYIADTSGPAGLAYMRDLFRTLSDGWGFDYFKIDGQPIVESLYTENRGLLDDPKADPLDSYRKGLQAIRDTIGPDRYLLGCWGTPLSGVGIMNGSRTGGDITATWQGMQPMLEATMNGYYLHNTAWYSDPDTLCVRSPLTLDQARVWASLMGLSGQALMASDKMTALPGQRVEILKRVFPATDIRPVDLYPYKRKPDTWDLRVNSPVGTWDVVGVFNWSNRTAAKELDLASLGAAGTEFHVWDFWNKAYLGVRSGKVRLLLPPTSCRVLSVHKVDDTPRVISTSRHITQGWLDLKAVAWNPATRELKGTSKVIAGDPYSVAIALPPGSPLVATGARVDKGRATLEEGESHVVLRVEPEGTGTVHWSVAFAQGAGVSGGVPEVPEPGAVTAEEDTTRKGSVILKWEGQANTPYAVYRNGALLGECIGTRIIDETAWPNSVYAYTVCRFDAGGKPRGGGVTTTVRTRAADSMSLCDLAPLKESQEWGTLGIGKSVDGNPLTVAGKRYDKGLGTHAKSEQVYALDGAVREFRALVGIDDEVGDKGSAEFKVYADGRLAWRSGVVKGSDKARAVSVPLGGVRELRLVTEPGTDNYHDHTDWVQPELLLR